MSDIFVEQQDDGTYEATQNRRVIARGDTQRQTIDRARSVNPVDPVLAERVRNTEVGGRDKWRRALAISKCPLVDACDFFEGSLKLRFSAIRCANSW